MNTTQSMLEEFQEDSIVNSIFYLRDRERKYTTCTGFTHTHLSVLGRLESDERLSTAPCVLQSLIGPGTSLR